MMKDKLRMLLLIAVLGGVLVSFLFINPHNGEIPLSEAVLQLSGSRGDLPMGTSLNELISFLLRIFPSYVFEMCFGIVFYRHFCTASVYVFSRYPKRVGWYLKEVLCLCGDAFLFQAVFLMAALLTAGARFRLYVDAAGLLVALYHFVIHALWVYAATLMSNLIAVKRGSSTAFAIVAGIQSVCVVLLGIERTIERYGGIALPSEGFLLAWNPMARLVMGWHTSGIEMLNQALHAPYTTIALNQSLLFCIVLCAVIVLAGAWIVKNHELLMSDSEMGV